MSLAQIFLVKYCWAISDTRGKCEHSSDNCNCVIKTCTVI